MSETNPVQQLPLHFFHAALDARMVPFAGWQMPVSYRSILEEHRMVREALGLFDVSHMGEFRISGPDAVEMLERLLPVSIKDLSSGQAVYAPLCREDGGVLDDLIAYRLSDSEFILVVNASNRSKDWRWIEEQAAGYEVERSDISDKTGLLALQGPKALGVAKKVFSANSIPARRFCFTGVTWKGRELLLSRTGYTGEDGLEIYCPVEVLESLADCLTSAIEGLGGGWCGLGARDSLRLEAGFPLYGHELGERHSPLTSGIGWTVNFSEEAFIGRQPILREREEGPSRRIIHFLLPGRRIARQGAEVLLADGSVVGEVCSGGLSPMLEQPMGSARVNRAALSAKQDLFVDLRGHRVQLDRRRPPLHLSGVDASSG